MDPDTLRKNPQFAALVSRIDNNLSREKGTSKVQRAFDEVHGSLTRARLDWLTNKIIYDEVHELLADLEIQGVENSLSSDEEKLKDLLNKTLSYAEIPDYLCFCPDVTSTSSLFCLTAEDVERHNPVKMHLNDLMNVVIPRLEEKLLKKCENLYAYFDPVDGQKTTSERLLAAKAHSLHTKVEEKKSRLDREKKYLQEIREKRDKQFWTYFQKLLECLAMLEKLIKDVKCISQTQTDNINVHSLWAHCWITTLKIRYANVDILCETYTMESVKALNSVRSHLDNATEQANREMSATTQSLHAFERLGPEFTALVEEVTHLKQELQNKRWGYQRFAQHAEPEEKQPKGPGASPAKSSGSVTSDWESIEKSRRV